MIGIYSMAAYSLNLVVGYGGLLSLCHAAFYGIGAYAYALLASKFAIPFIPAIFGAIAITAVLALMISFPALRFRGDMFVFVTFHRFSITFRNFSETSSAIFLNFSLSIIPRAETGLTAEIYDFLLSVS
jgi:branched-chain amino acid transport system permease protein